eukprot:460093_1
MINRNEAFDLGSRRCGFIFLNKHVRQGIPRLGHSKRCSLVPGSPERPKYFRPSARSLCGIAHAKQPYAPFTQAATPFSKPHLAKSVETDSVVSSILYPGWQVNVRVDPNPKEPAVVSSRSPCWS